MDLDGWAEMTEMQQDSPLQDSCSIVQMPETARLDAAHGPNADVVQLLEEALEKAKRGDITGFVLVYATTNFSTQSVRHFEAQGHLQLVLGAAYAELQDMAAQFNASLLSVVDGSPAA